jgi:hypothetical protein
VGEYSKSRQSIIEPVVKIPDGAVAAPRLDEETRVDVQRMAVETAKKHAVKTVKDLDKDRYILRKTTGWLMATLVIIALGGAVSLGSNYFTRGHQVDHLQDEIHSLDGRLEETRKAHQVLERRLVELQTQLELLQEEGNPCED